MEQSQKNRAVYSTLLNHTSSRSHSIFTINIVRAPIDDEDYVIEVRVLHSRDGGSKF